MKKININLKAIREFIKAKYKIGLWIIGSIVAIYIILGLVFLGSTLKVYSLAKQIQSDLSQAQHEVINRNFSAGRDLINKSHGELVEADKLMNGMVVFGYLPLIRNNYWAGANLIKAGLQVTEGGADLLSFADEFFSKFANESITYATMTNEQRRDVLARLVASRDLMYRVKGNIDIAVGLIEKISDHGLISPLAKVVAPIKTYGLQARDLLDQSLPMLDVVPIVSGYPTEKRYLFLLQNNSELRPTGGFIGTYGILDMKDGEIVEFKTDNIYNLDIFVEGLLNIEPPKPLIKYLTQDHWYLRDSNWSPDFPTTAKKAEEFYYLEKGVIDSMNISEAQEKNPKIAGVTPLLDSRNLDGVIAVTPVLIEDLLKITGPISVGGIRFTDENLVDELEFRVGKEYEALGISDSNRKQIIKALADQIKIRLTSMPYDQLLEVVKIAAKALNEKEVLIYDHNNDLENLISERNWGGEVKATAGDYFYIVDANMASLKTDQVMGRYAKYSITKNNGNYIAELKVTYNHGGSFNWKTTRYRDYVRVYLPKGSQLISSNGFVENDKIQNPQQTPVAGDVYQELDKTVVAGFISIEPHETGTFTLKYQLPDNVKNQIEKGSYSLLMQKQPGTTRYLTLDLKFGKNIKSATPAGDLNWLGTNYSLGNLILNTDKEIDISFK